jgi:hypothetical protein
MEPRHLSQRIEAPADDVYEYASDPANVPEWAPGLGTAVEQVDGRWYVETPMGRASVVFADRNPYGVLDHEVTLPSGEVFHNPMRVIPDGDACDAVFTLRRQAGMSDAEFERDATAVAGDLTRLKGVVEGRRTD